MLFYWICLEFYSLIQFKYYCYKVRLKFIVRFFKKIVLRNYKDYRKLLLWENVFVDVIRKLNSECKVGRYVDVGQEVLNLMIYVIELIRIEMYKEGE